MSAPGRGSALLRAAIASRTPVVLPLAARRYYAATDSAAAEPSQSSSTAASSTPPPPVSSSTTTTTTTDAPSTATDPSLYRIKSSLILTRPPLLTRDQTPFESAFYLYQKRLNERLTAPFRREFYFKKDTASDLDFRIKLAERRGVPAKDIGRYNPRGRTAWNDEVLVGSTTSDPDTVRERLLADAVVTVSEDGEPLAVEERIPVERPAPRRSEADEKRDVRRLDRAMDRTLYLVVRRGGAGKAGEGEEGVWEFPTGVVPTEEALHETAARVLTESAGPNMNTWIVGRVPVAHHVVKPVVGEDGTSVVKRGEKIFFLKGRIMAGQADLTGNKHGLTDFQWLTSDELQEVLAEDYYYSVRNMMDLR
ncbi:39S mitochondrial ribosomal protein L46-domain-containing protein [Corynascus novoguineensis]|uniref:Large ribosomal subunit protein mL46 n=1 Tax=Corynascus novoguineensis TaxID=1126955 RepID=A0AAN7D1R2_9PEZI|nr:39S mitochondrial ribosomal protein L46-domain-containing protein [Corynascus novoguineensis]